MNANLKKEKERKNEENSCKKTIEKNILGKKSKATPKTEVKMNVAGE
jgi:hypothetical protein